MYVLKQTVEVELPHKNTSKLSKSIRKFILGGEIKDSPEGLKYKRAGLIN